MKVAVLTLFALILSVTAVEKIVQPATDVDQLTAKSLYDTIFAEYYTPPKEPAPSKKISKNKSSSNRNQGSQNGGSNYGYNNKQSNDKKDNKYDPYSYEKYLQLEDYKAEYNRLIGRKGLGYDGRTATSYGLRAPITPELLAVYGQQYQKGEGYKNNDDLYAVLF